jgi:hypothetical protein
MKIEPGPIVWRDNLGLRGLTSLAVTFDEANTTAAAQSIMERPTLVAPAASASGCPFHGTT